MSIYVTAYTTSAVAVSEANYLDQNVGPKQALALGRHSKYEFWKIYDRQHGGTQRGSRSGE